MSAEPLTDDELTRLRAEAEAEQGYPGKHGQWERLVLRLLETISECEGRVDQGTYERDAAIRRAADVSAALEWALAALTPFSHSSECSPMRCVCGYDSARAALRSQESQKPPERSES